MNPDDHLGSQVTPWICMNEPSNNDRRDHNGTTVFTNSCVLQHIFSMSTCSCYRLIHLTLYFTIYSLPCTTWYTQLLPSEIEYMFSTVLVRFSPSPPVSGGTTIPCVICTSTIVSAEVPRMQVNIAEKGTKEYPLSSGGTIRP